MYDYDWECIIDGLVKRFDKMYDGRIVMETENSIYTFKPIHRGDNNDLPG